MKKGFLTAFFLLGTFSSFTSCSSPKTYTITWKNDDGSVLSITKVKSGKKPVYDKETPMKEPTDSTVYTFNGWSPELVKATSDATYTATYSSSIRKYTIWWYNDIEETKLLHTEDVEYNTFPTYHWSDKPSKPETDRIRYDWNGWKEGIVRATSNAVYHADYDEVNKYLVTFKNEDGTVLQESYVAEDSLPVYKGKEPTKPSDVQYSYKFKDWDKKFVKPTDDTSVYTATYTPTLRKYTISWYNDKDATTPLHTEELEYGETPTYHWEDKPAKAETDRKRYDWNGKWEETIVTVAGEAHYHAKFDEVNKYLITYKNYDGTILQESYVPSNIVPVYEGEQPTRLSDAQYTYEPVGWDKDEEKPTCDTVYIYTYDPVVNKYKITWNGGINGDVFLKEETLAYGSTPTPPANVPEKLTDEVYEYTFLNTWSPVVTDVTGETTYVAQYSQSLKSEYKITWKNWDDTLLLSDSVAFKAIPLYEGDTPTKIINGHSFDWLGWDKEILPATIDTTYKAVFDNDITFDFEGTNCTINGKDEFTDVYTFDELNSINYIIKPIGTYALPDAVSVYVDNDLISSDKYTYDKSTGAFSIASNLGNVRLEVIGA